MLIDRYDKNGKQIALGDYLLYKGQYPYKVDFDNYLLAYGVVDLSTSTNEFEMIFDWVEEDWEYTTYEALQGEVS